MPRLKTQQISKQDIVETLAEIHPNYSKEELAEIFDTSINIIQEALVSDTRVCIGGFGAFNIKKIQGGPKWAPGVSKFVDRPERKTASFRAYQRLDTLMNRRSSGSSE